MSVQTDFASGLARTEWATRFVDAITITDMTSRGTYNTATLQYDTPTTSTVYSGNALIRAERDTIKTRGEQGETLYTHSVYVPWDTTGVAPNNVVSVTSSATDTDLTGATLTVQSVHQDTYNTRRELRCLLSQGGGDRG